MLMRTCRFWQGTYARLKAIWACDPTPSVFSVTLWTLHELVFSYKATAPVSKDALAILASGNVTSVHLMVGKMHTAGLIVYDFVVHAWIAVWIFGIVALLGLWGILADRETPQAIAMFVTGLMAVNIGVHFVLISPTHDAGTGYLIWAFIALMSFVRVCGRMPLRWAQLEQFVIAGKRARVAPKKLPFTARLALASLHYLRTH